jgi:hypothetical protein
MRKVIRFRHLKERGIVDNWPQVKRLVEQQGFPPGRYLGANTRVWLEDEIDDWLDTRPTAGQDPNDKPAPQRDRAAAGQTIP